MGILARQSWAQRATSGSAAKLTFRDVQDAQAIPRFVRLMTDGNVQPALSVCDGGMDGDGAARQPAGAAGGVDEEGLTGVRRIEQAE